MRSPSPTLSLLPRGWGVAPSARSTPTLPTQAQRSVGKGTPKIISYSMKFSIITNVQP
ncbi:MAG: hypothetical protein NZ455_05475 [Bacteroidia bacterium]|nr:hypothetical protein [Bacteroidia bacterium]MDW8346350.1 hypothetical protein [Bacteroidia bacterium]